MKRGRLLYAFVAIATLGVAWFSGERVVFLAAMLLFILPFVGAVASLVMLYAMRHAQSAPRQIMRGAPGVLHLSLRNMTPLPFTGVTADILADKAAIIMDEPDELSLSAMRRHTVDIPFTPLYRGQYTLGLAALHARDMTGLVSLRRRTKKYISLTVLPQVPDLAGFPLAMNLLTQATSRYDIRDEDYSTISDIRQYVPTDSIKRVHWKLTAKRQEWLVKVFQSNALNTVSIIMDVRRVQASHKEILQIETNMVEMAAGLAKFCLTHAMPICFHTTKGAEIHAVNGADFGTVYSTLADMQFTADIPLTPSAILKDVVSGTTGYVNAVVLAAELDDDIVERVISARGSGHHVAVVYFPGFVHMRDYQRRYDALREYGVQVFRITADEGILL
jgi:uncharacterized protein (DUF58 family)